MNNKIFEYFYVFNGKTRIIIRIVSDRLTFKIWSLYSSGFFWYNFNTFSLSCFTLCWCIFCWSFSFYWSSFSVFFWCSLRIFSRSFFGIFSWSFFSSCRLFFWSCFCILYRGSFWIFCCCSFFWCCLLFSFLIYFSSCLAFCWSTLCIFNWRWLSRWLFNTSHCEHSGSFLLMIITRFWLCKNCILHIIYQLSLINFSIIINIIHLKILS